MNFKDEQLNSIKRLFNQIINETYGLERESLDAFRFIPAQSGLQQWIDTWTYKVLSEFGVAKVISDYAQDLPPVSRALELKTLRIFEIGLSWGYSEFELMKWLTAGVDLSRDDAETARRKIDEKVDEILFFGEKSLGTEGLVNNSNVTKLIVDDNGSGSTKWKNKTLAQIVADVQSMINTIRTVSKRTVKADTILLPHDAFVYVSTTPKDSNGGDMTILEYLKKVFADQGITTWDECSKLEGAGEGGADRAIIYKKAPNILAYVLPIPFKQGEVQAQALAYKVPAYARVGGVAIKNIKGIAYADGV